MLEQIISPDVLGLNKKISDLQFSGCCSCVRVPVFKIIIRFGVEIPEK